MTPEEINAKHGRAVWKCNQCGTIKGLHWWRGMSVASCGAEECLRKEQAVFDGGMAQQEAEEAAWREWLGN